MSSQFDVLQNEMQKPFGVCASELQIFLYKNHKHAITWAVKCDRVEHLK